MVRRTCLVYDTALTVGTGTMTAVGTNAHSRHAVIRILCFLVHHAHTRRKQSLIVHVVNLASLSTANPALILFHLVTRSVTNLSPAIIFVNNAATLVLVRLALYK